MDKLMLFIESLRDCSTENISEYCERFKELVDNIEIYGVRKIIMDNSWSIHIGNIYIKSYNDECVCYLHIIINNKLMKFRKSSICGSIIDGPVSDVVKYHEDTYGEFLYIKSWHESLIEVKNVNIDWLLGHEFNKSTRK